MTKLFSVLFAASIGAYLAFQSTVITSGSSLPANCVTGGVFVKTGTSAGLYACVGGSWTGPFATSAGSITTPGSTTDNAIVRWDGTGGTAIQNSGITVDDSNVIAFPDGVKQTFNPNGTNAGLNFGSQAGDPSSLADGDCWYNSTTTKFRCRQNGSTTDMIGGGGTGDLLDWQYVEKTADEMVESSVTLQNDDHLVLALGTNQTWRLTMHLLLTTENNNEAPDFLAGFTLPTGATISFTQNCMSNSATGVGSHAPFFASAYQNSGGTANILCGILSTADTPASPLFLEGIVKTGGTSGNLQLQWAQNSSNADGTIVKAESNMFMRRTQ